MLRDRQFKIMMSDQEEDRVLRTAELMGGLSKADVFRVAFFELERRVLQETTKSNPQEQPVTA
jgi:hypothetical protein